MLYYLFLILNNLINKALLTQILDISLTDARVVFEKKWATKHQNACYYLG